MMKLKRKTTLVTLSVLLAVGAARAESTGWISGRDLWNVTGKYDQRGMMPVAVECKDSTREGLDLAAGLVKVEWAPNPKGIAWHWQGSTNLKYDVTEMKKRGYRLVAKDSFVRKKSGLPVYCLIFHK